MPWAKCRKSTERTVDFYLTECTDDATVDVLARRIAGGGGEAGGADLSVYDGFLKGAVADGS